MQNPTIALIGNMNNNFAAFCRYLRDERYHATLYLLDDDYFTPDQDSFTSDWKRYTKRLSWGSLQAWAKADSKAIRDKFLEYDLVIGCGSVPAYFYRAGLSLDVFIPYGSDLYDIPFFRMVKPQRIWSRLQLAKYQKKGIRASKCVFMAPSGGILEKPLKNIGYSGPVFPGGVPMVYYPEYESSGFIDYQQKSNLTKIVGDLKTKGNTIIMHSSRHYWKTKKDERAIKGNDHLFRALRQYLDFFDDKPPKPLHIITFDYGVDVGASKNLIIELKLESYVTWITKSPRKDIMLVLSMADMVVGELHHSYFTYGIIYEALALGKMIIHKSDRELYRFYYPELYPMEYADGTDSLFKVFKSIAEGDVNPESNGSKGFEWFTNNLVEEPLKEIKTILGQ